MLGSVHPDNHQILAPLMPKRHDQGDAGTVTAQHDAGQLMGSWGSSLRSRKGFLEEVTSELGPVG